MEISEIREQAGKAAALVCDAAGLRAGDLFVVGCSSSEVRGHGQRRDADWYAH